MALISTVSTDIANSWTTVWRYWICGTELCSACRMINVNAINGLGTKQKNLLKVFKKTYMFKKLTIIGYQ
jgi:hypothetical protein